MDSTLSIPIHSRALDKRKKGKERKGRQSPTQGESVLVVRCSFLFLLLREPSAFLSSLPLLLHERSTQNWFELAKR